ncbi:MAG: AIPR family protein [Gemmatimonadales bacterium]|jgi:hypothetical protein
MDRITTALLAEFSHDNGIEALEEEHRFERFAAYLAVAPHLLDTPDTGDLATGAGGDTGIDAIAIIVNGSLVTDAEFVPELVEANGYLDVVFVFVQAERSAAFEAAKIGTFGFGVTDFFREPPTLPRNAAVQEAAATMNAIYALSPRFVRGNPICRLCYVTTGKWLEDANLVARRRAVVDDLSATRLFREVTFACLGADEVQKLYNQSKNAIARDFTFADKTVLPDMPNVSEAYIGLLPAPAFLALLQDDSGNLIKTIFDDNVRDWQDYNTVNTEIRRTLEAPDLRARFALMNNGVTVIAKTLRATGNRFHIEDYQIVNGCQTSHVLFDQRSVIDGSVMVPLRLIATQDEDVIAAIVKATNRQTQVKEEQLLALNDFQKKLEAFFATFDPARRLYYERRSRQYDTVAGVEKTRIITLTNLIRAYASVVLEEPHRTTRNFRALREKVGAEIFHAEHRLEPYYLAASALYRLEYLFRNGSIDAKFKPARYHILLAARLLASGQRPPRPNSRDAARWADDLSALFWDPVRAEELLHRAVQVIEGAAAGNLHRDNIRTQPFSQLVVEACRGINPAT